MHPKWTGIYPAVTTQFLEDGSLDLKGFCGGIEAQIQAGVDGIIVCGSLGENSTLDCEEKFSLLHHAKKQCDGRVPVILCLAECATKAAISFVLRAQAEGADGLMILPPMRYLSDDLETLTYLRKVVTATPLPVMIYNNPIAYKTLITQDIFQALAEYPQVQSMKESTGDVRNLTDLRNAFGNRFRILTGVDDLALESLMMGADGWVAGLVCAFPRETVAIYRLSVQGKWDEAREIYRWFYPLLHLDVSNKLVQNIKLAQSLTGMGTEFVRQPRLPLYGNERENVLKIIQQALATRPKLPQGSHGGL
ncbi:MAG TPA: dihydrodipicolinate synthase family protein [Chitinophagaceae bacterium]|nr:dihydrodipicolinate synthase family protein [Chitinophagaceae bacterium]